MKNQQHSNLLFQVRISICYHARRQFFFQVLSRWSNVPLLLLGAGTAVLALQDGSWWILGAGLGTALVSILKLIIPSEDKVAWHAELLRDYTVLANRLYASSSRKTVKAVFEDNMDLDFLAPQGKYVVWALCHNTLIRTMDLAGKKDPIAVAWWQRLTAHFFDLGTNRFAKKDQGPAAASGSRTD